MSAATRQVSRSIIYGGSALSRENQLRRLASGNRTKFEQMAMFLRAIDLSNFAENTHSQKIAKLSGTERGRDNKRRVGVKVIVAGGERVANAEGENSYTIVPGRQYMLLDIDYVLNFRTTKKF